MEKFFVISSVAKGTVEPVNLSNIYTFRKQNPNLVNSSDWAIAFYKSEQLADHNTIKWKYDTEEARDCDYKKLINNFATDINIIE